MTDARMVALSIAYGLTLVALVATFANISGAHFNPAVSAAFFVTGNMSFLKTAAYIIAQVGGFFARYTLTGQYETAKRILRGFLVCLFSRK